MLVELTRQRRCQSPARFREDAAELLEAIDPDDATDIVAQLPSRRS